MADCQFALQNLNIFVERVNPGVQYSGTMTNQFDVKYFDYEMAEQETVTFTINIDPHTTQPINVELRLYNKDFLGNIQEIGQAFLTDFNNSFTYDGVPAQYWFCISTDFPVNYSLTLDYTNYPYTLFTAFDAYDGSFMPVWDFAAGVQFCEKSVVFEIIDGVLPPGLGMSDSGEIFGQIEELDCYPPYKDEPPSWTKYEIDEETGESFPTTMDFPIIVRASLQEARDTYVDRSFTICISNDWSPQRDSFNDTKDNMEQEIYSLNEFTEDEENQEVSENILQPILNVNCDPCIDEPQVSIIPQPLDEEELKRLCEMCQINEEYQGLIEINNDGLCVPCEEETDNLIVSGLQDIVIDSLCDKCDEPEPIVGIQNVVLQPLCEPCEVEEIEPINQLPEFFRGVPNFQLPEFVNKIMTEKACTPFNVEKLKDYYPMIPETKIEINSACPEVCE